MVSQFGVLKEDDLNVQLRSVRAQRDATAAQIENNSLSADEKRLFSRMAEVYAAYSEYTDVQIGRIIGPVSRADLAPFLHQRYDDLSVLGRKD